jgi:hemoglobin/transferrin/lactoferrin receptor protein
MNTPACPQNHRHTRVIECGLLAMVLLTGCATAQAQTGVDQAENDRAANESLALDDLVVVGSKTARPLYTVAGQVTIIDRERMDRELVSRFTDIARYEPALEVDFDNARFAGTGISIRGIGGNRIAYELDGVPLPQQFDVGSFANSARTSIDPEIVQRVEILRGPASALYGSDAIGGAVVVSTMDAADLIAPGEHSAVTARLGYFGVDASWLASSTLAYAHDRDGILLSASVRDGNQPDNKAQSVPSDLVDYTQYQWFGKWTRRMDHGGELRTSIDYYHRDTDADLQAVLGFARFRNTTAILGDDRQRRDRITVNYLLPQLDWLQHGSVMVYRQVSDTEQLTDEQRFVNGDGLQLQRDFFLRETGYGGELKGQLDFTTGSLRHLLVAGAEWDHLSLVQSRDGSQLDQSNGVSSNVVLGESFPLRDFPRSSIDEVGFYVQDEITLGELTLTPALRYDHYRLAARTDELFIDPQRLTSLSSDELTMRFGASWRVHRRLSVYAQFAEGFRAPPAEDINLFLDIPQFNLQAIPNPELRPERSDNFETGLRWFGPSTSIEAAFYYSDFDDFIESRVALGPDPDSGVLLFQSRNLARANIYGAEATLRQSLGVLGDALQPWSLQAGLHWARGENDVTGQPLNTVNPWTLVLALNWTPRADVSVDLRLRHIARQGRTDFSGTEFFVPPMANILDITAQWQPCDWMQWQLGLFNLTDQRYWRFPDVRRFAPGDPSIDVLSQPGIHASLALRLSY